jgi:hypothetical protein
MSRPHFWTAKVVAMLGKDTDKAVAQKLGVTPTTVFLQRSKRGIPPYGRRSRMPNWGQTELSLLQTYSDKEIAKLTGRSVPEIAAKRRALQQR